MADLKQLNDALNEYIRPQTFPVALKMCRSASELPEKVRVPSKDMKYPIMVCQAVSMARRYGWMLALGKEDVACTAGAVTLGFVDPAKYLDGSYSESLVPGSKERAAKRARLMERLEYGKYSHLLVSPLQNASFQPDAIVIYANSAQVMRLVQAATNAGGDELSATSAGGMDCSDIMARTMLTDQCQFILPSGGDRVFGLTQDHEMLFTIPFSKIETVVKGLETTHRAGFRYPVLSFLRFKPDMPPNLDVARYTKFIGGGK